MITENFTYASADQKTNIHAVRWMPESGCVCAVLQITHGMIEFIERYEEFAQYIVEQGFLVVGHDHLGHGQSVVSESEWGYFGMDHPSDLLVEDMHRLRTITQEQYPKLPYFMLGHSMGSYMLRKYLALKADDKLTGAIILGTGYVPLKTTKLGQRVVRFMARFKGWHYRSKMVATLSFGKPYRKFDLTGKDLTKSWLTKDIEKVKVYSDDPRCHFMFTLNGYLGLYEAVQFAGLKENANRIPKDLPLLILSGADDPVGDSGAGVQYVYDMYQEVGILDITYKLYENDRHEILNETDRQDVYHDIYAWLSRTSKRSLSMKA